MYVDNIRQSSERMREMLNTLLDFFRLDNGKEQPNLNSSLSTSLENIPAGIYELTITDEKGILAGEFIYEN